MTEDNIDAIEGSQLLTDWLRGIIHMAQKSFGDHFRFAMESLGIGIVCPDTVFKSATASVATIRTLASLVDEYGTKVTVNDILRTVPAGVASAAFLVEATKVAGGILAAGYAGVCIGSLAYAAGQYSAERLWTIEDEPIKMTKPYKIINTSYKYNIQISQQFKNYIYQDFQRQIKMKCLSAH